MVLKATYAVLPAKAVTNAELCAIHNLEGAHVLERMGGVQQRRYWPQGESLVGLSGLAARGALDLLGPPRNQTRAQANHSIGTLIHCTTTPDSCSPAMAHRLHRELELGPTTQCFDVSSSCTSVLSALRVAALAGESALIVSAEAKSRHIARGDGRTASLFGDGSVALVIGSDPVGAGLQSESDPDHFVWLEPFVDSSLVDNIRVTAGDGAYLTMSNGRLMYRRTVAAFVTMIERALVQAQLRDIAVHRVFLHQANANLLRDVKSHFPKLFAPVLMSDVGNLVSASLPVHRVRALILEGIANWWWSSAASRGQSDAGAHRAEVLGRLGRFLSNERGTFKIGARYGAELLRMEDRAATGVMDSWLSRISDGEWTCFFDEYSRFLESKQSKQSSDSRVPCDVWIGAGGGFQALGALHLLPQQFGPRLSSLITGEDSDFRRS